MRIKTAIGVSGGLLAYMFGISIWAWAQVPADALIAIHWNAHGQANGYAGRNALFLTPAISFGLALLLGLIPRLEPRGLNLARSRKAYIATWIAVMVVMAGTTTVVALNAVASGALARPSLVIPVGVGLLLLVVGNYLGKVRSNFFFGVRTPWTLSSDLAWNKTHRLAARLFVIWGLLVLVSVAAPDLSVVVVLGGALVNLVILVGYSYLVWRRDPAKLDIGRRPLARRGEE